MLSNNFVSKSRISRASEKAKYCQDNLKSKQENRRGKTGNQPYWVLSPGLFPAHRVTLGKSLHLSVPEFPAPLLFFKNGVNDT